jgi:hypothetical protein
MSTHLSKAMLINFGPFLHMHVCCKSFTPMIWTPSFPATLTTLGGWASLDQKLRNSGPKLEAKV